MAARANLPKIITDIQDIVTQLGDDFKSSNNEPITDDSHALHRLCAKLEFLLSSCNKEKSVLGSKKSYWHWIYVCLKNTKGLGDGLKYVQANKEIRSSKGKGRAFIRYCLVHQTLADSLQNCVMNPTVTRQYFTSNSILVNPTYSSAFVTSLYDLNAVNFDLNAKGYDLDAGWPTFASKIRNSIPSDMDQWAMRSVASLGSFPSASVVMDTPRMHGSGSSGPHSVDQRVEELVLELDQSDQRIKEQQQEILDLESKTDNLVASTGEKEEILARVISDMESKNRHLHSAMSNMSSEFQAREQQWSEKHNGILKELSTCNAKNKELFSKVQQLEQDKRTLEDTVSQRMSTITSTFLPTAENDTFLPINSLTSSQIQETNSKLAKETENLRSENRNLSEELDKSRQRCIDLQMRLDAAAAGSNVVDEMVVQLETKQGNIDNLEQKLSTFSSEHQLFINNVKEALSLTGDAIESSTMVKEIVKLRERCQNEIDTFQQSPNHDDVIQSASLKEENELLKFDRDIAHLDADSLKQKLRMAQLKIQKLQVEKESTRNESVNRIRELEENLSIQQHQLTNQERHHKEMLADLKLTQDALQQSDKELEETKQRYKDLEQKERNSQEEHDKCKQVYEDDISENEFAIEELQAEVQHHVTLNESLDRQLETEMAKCSRLNGDLVAANEIVKSFTQQLNDTKNSVIETEETLSHLRLEVTRLTAMELVHEKEISFLTGLIETFLGQMKLIDGSKDLSKLKLEKKSQDFDSNCDDEDLQKWKNLTTMFCNIALEYKDNKDKLNSLQSQHSEEQAESSSYKLESGKEITELKEQLGESQATNDIHLITIKDLSDKHKVLQDRKAENLDKIERLNLEIRELNQSLEGSKKVEDELRLRVMKESTERLGVEEKQKIQEEDIENLKDKVTQLLLDKDHLWKEGELLRDCLEDQVDVVEEVSWVEDEDVTHCSSCGTQFTMTLRKHHCRNCGQIFCKNCSSNWRLKDKKRARFCDHCYNSPDLDMSGVSTEKFYSPSSRSTSKDCEQLSDDTCSVLDDTENNTSKTNDVTDSIFANRNHSQSSARDEDTVVVEARREFHLPVYIEQPGMTLHWEITTDRDISFKICYAPTEEEAMLELVPLRRINPHIEPFIGDLVARQKGLYTLVFDNTYSSLLHVDIYQVEIIIVKHLIQGHDNVAWVRVNAGSSVQCHHKIGV